MKIPNIAYEVELDVSSKKISFYRRRNYNPDVNPEYLKLPKWLADEMKSKVDSAYNAGIESIRIELRKMLGIRP